MFKSTHVKLQSILPSTAQTSAVIGRCVIALALSLGFAPLAPFVVGAGGVFTPNHHEHNGTPRMNPLYVICHPGEKNPIGKEWGNNGINSDELTKRLAIKPNLTIGILLGQQTGLIDVECDG